MLKVEAIKHVLVFCDVPPFFAISGHLAFQKRWCKTSQSTGILELPFLKVSCSTETCQKTKPENVTWESGWLATTLFATEHLVQRVAIWKSGAVMEATLGRSLWYDLPFQCGDPAALLDSHVGSQSRGSMPPPPPRRPSLVSGCCG